MMILALSWYGFCPVSKKAILTFFSFVYYSVEVLFFFFNIVLQVSMCSQWEVCANWRTTFIILKVIWTEIHDIQEDLESNSLS